MKYSEKPAPNALSRAVGTAGSLEEGSSRQPRRRRHTLRNLLHNRPRQPACVLGCAAVPRQAGRRGAALRCHKAVSHRARSVKCGAACQQGGAGPAPEVSGTGNASPVHLSKSDGSAAACVHPWDKGQPRDQGWWGIMEPPSCCPGSPPGAEAPACPMSHLPLIAL